MRAYRPFLILLIAASVLNVLVAWACISWSPYTSHTKPSDKPSASGYPPTTAGPYGQQAWWFSAAGFGVWQSVPSGARGADGQFLYWRGSHTPAYYRGGWPMHALQSTVTFHNYEARWDLPAREILRRGIQTSWLPSWLHAHEHRRLPVVPLWPDFVINIVLYFGVLIAGRLFCVRVLLRTPNQPDAPNAAIALVGQAGRHWRGVGDPERSLRVMIGRLPIAFVVSCAFVAGCDTGDQPPPATRTPPHAVKSPGTLSNAGLEAQGRETGVETGGISGRDAQDALVASAPLPGCRSNKLAWGWESLDDAEFRLEQYKHVLIVRIDEDFSTGRGPYGLTAHNYRATVVRSYKGNWRTGEKIAFVHYVDSPPSAMPPRNALSGELRYVFTNEHTDSQIALDTGEFGAYCEQSMAPALEAIYPARSR